MANFYIYAFLFARKSIICCMLDYGKAYCLDKRQRDKLAAPFSRVRSGGGEEKRSDDINSFTSLNLPNSYSRFFERKTAYKRICLSTLGGRGTGHGDFVISHTNAKKIPIRVH